MENAVLTSNTSVSESETFVSGVDRTILRDLARENQKNAQNTTTTTTDTKKAQSPGKKNDEKIPKKTTTRRKKSTSTPHKNTKKRPKTTPKSTKMTQEAHQEDHKKTTKKSPKNTSCHPRGGVVRTGVLRTLNLCFLTFLLSDNPINGLPTISMKSHPTDIIPNPIGY